MSLTLSESLNLDTEMQPTEPYVENAPVRYLLDTFGKATLMIAWLVVQVIKRWSNQTQRCFTVLVSQPVNQTGGSSRVIPKKCHLQEFDHLPDR